MIANPRLNGIIAHEAIIFDIKVVKISSFCAQSTQFLPQKGL
mgnify:CR=1 FL=1|jgi:hypothetical protein